MKRLLFCAILLGCHLLSGAAAAQQFLPDGTVPHLQVRGEAELRVPADQLQLTLGIITEAATAQAALARNSAGMKKVEQVLAKSGLTPPEYRTGHFDIRPQWSLQPRPDHQPEITGYQVTSSFTITTARLEIAGPLIEAATQAGAIAIGDLRFGLADPDAHRAEAVRQATSRALAEARVLAAAAAVTLGEILFVTMDDPAVYPQQLQAVRFEAMAGEPPLSPGDVSVRAGVTISFRIVP